MNDEYLFHVSVEKKPKQEVIPEAIEVTGTRSGSRLLAAGILFAILFFILWQGGAFR